MSPPRWQGNAQPQTACMASTCKAPVPPPHPLHNERHPLSNLFSARTVGIEKHLPNPAGHRHRIATTQHAHPLSDTKDDALRCCVLTTRDTPFFDQKEQGEALRYALMRPAGWRWYLDHLRPPTQWPGLRRRPGAPRLAVQRPMWPCSRAGSCSL